MSLPGQQTHDKPLSWGRTHILGSPLASWEVPPRIPGAKRMRLGEAELGVLADALDGRSAKWKLGKPKTGREKRKKRNPISVLLEVYYTTTIWVSAVSLAANHEPVRRVWGRFGARRFGWWFGEFASTHLSAICACSLMQALERGPGWGSFLVTEQPTTKHYAFGT